MITDGQINKDKHQKEISRMTKRHRRRQKARRFQTEIVCSPLKAVFSFWHFARFISAVVFFSTWREFSRHSQRERPKEKADDR